jgi:gamma-glutamyltranspeptidase/glutathione hydrolase
VVNLAVNLIDFEMDLERAIAAPRLSQRNSGATSVDQGFATTSLGRSLSNLGHELMSQDEIGAANGIVVNANGAMTAVAEPIRRGGGHAMALN